MEPATYNPQTGRALYRFDNGYSVSVIPDGRGPLHFELLVRGPGDGPVKTGIAARLGIQGDGLAAYLTSDQARDLLDRVAALDPEA